MSSHSGGRRVRKITRACDRCRAKKLRCSGTKPCNICVSRKATCAYELSYARGRPPTPTRAVVATHMEDNAIVAHEGNRDTGSQTTGTPEPEVAAEDVHGQFVGRTSGLSFLRRAQKVFSRNAHGNLDDTVSIVEDAPVMAAGDKRLLGRCNSFAPPIHQDALTLLELYFDVCHATYRPLHRPSVREWLEIMQRNTEQQAPLHTTMGRAKAAVLMGIFAITTFHQQKSLGFASDEDSMLKSDSYCQAALELTDGEVGLPQLESVQARLIQVFYFLMTSRMNRAWYVFGNVIQLISALGLHRMNHSYTSGRSRSSYITLQCRRRVFWTAYILDKYLGTLLGRPTHFQDEDINLDYPDCVNDEDMTPTGPAVAPDTDDCQTDAFVFNAKLSRIVAKVSRELYPVRPLAGREYVSLLNRLNRELEQWRSSLPAYLSTVRPSSLVRSFRRQNMALKVAYCHAVMHTNRSSLLRLSSIRTPLTSAYEASAIKCVHFALEVLGTVNAMAREGPIFHAFWWTHYVTFCALSVAHVWQLQRQKCRLGIEDSSQEKLSHLMESCEIHLAKATATNSPSRRYSIILKELQSEAIRTQGRNQMDEMNNNEMQDSTRSHNGNAEAASVIHTVEAANEQIASQSSVDQSWLDAWTATDWLDLDASAFCNFDDLSPSSLSWLDETANGNS